MNILQVTNKVPFPARDGGAIACMNLTKGFSQLGNRVTVLAMNTLKHHVHPDEIPDEINQLATFKLVDVPAQINAFAALANLLFSRKPYNAVRFINKNFSTALVDLISENQFDIIQFEGLYVCPYIPLIRKYSNATLVYRAHNIEFEIWERAAKLSRGLKKIYLQNLSKRIKRFETGLLNSYDLLVPITDRDGNILDSLGNIKDKQVSPTGIDSSVVVPDTSSLEFPSLFHIGSLEWAPNQDGLLWFIKNCWTKIHNKYPDLRFYIAGRNAPRWLIDKLNVEGVFFEGEVNDAYQFMNSKAIMIVPLFSGSGMRIKIIEGMALGKSIVSTSIGAEGINVSDGANILMANEATRFIKAVSNLLEDRDCFERIGRNASLFIQQNFDNLVLSKRLIGFYKQYTK
ncbi:Glycosyltransferase involved in cell wall bisynthesis [Draconibacterium orientale]|uniref:Glycosyl transferase family 1 n=1 Tax=Draconibacterium orientale TaxID=1168034 RepID=X5DCH6_9BACT|nr:glycosyltransferase family 4 protein [Draconibacterium orientale]AHW58659.1 glycosyl transferase family 1 [Draconibacterium orientale]SET13088.1 Glycosyltransferase involved in cell wall bisynthesis [Draconibacterium orientale]